MVSKARYDVFAKNYDIPDKILSHEEEIDLGIRKDKGDKYATEELLRHNIRLVISEASRFLESSPSVKIDLEDLVQEGAIGLTKAIEKYDPAIRTRFSTYALYWIDMKIRRAIKNQGRLIRVPERQQDANPKSYPDKYTDVNEQEELIEDKKYDNSKDIEKDDLANWLDKKAMKTLTPRDWNIMKLRYGLNGEAPLTQSETAEEIKGISRQAIHLVEKKSLKKLRERLENLKENY